MPTIRPLLTDFSAGELSPKLDGRVDLGVYFKGAKEITNFRIQTLGGVNELHRGDDRGAYREIDSMGHR
jgi:hypothetical protein